MKDFEDAMQVAAALACGAEVIATRNMRDYAQAPHSSRNTWFSLERVEEDLSLIILFFLFENIAHTLKDFSIKESEVLWVFWFSTCQSFYI